MIIIKVMGGLGNQMFQFAYGENLRCVNNLEVKYDVSYFLDTPKGDTLRDSFAELLGFTDIIATDAEIANVLKCDKKILNRLLSKLGCYRSSIRNEGDIIEDNCYLIGYWQSESFFANIKTEIQKKYDFSRFELSDKAKKVLEKIQREENSTSIHVRAGDYLLAENYHIFGEICTEEYYNKACDYIIKNNPNSKFFLFSNDINWVRENNILPDYSIIDVSTELQGESDWVEMYLMSCCKNNIIANSSYSWWSAWLNKNAQKIVVCPSKWTNNDGDDKIFCKDWIRL